MSRSMMTLLRERSLCEWGRRLLVVVVLVMANVVRWESAAILLCVLGGVAWVVPVVVEGAIVKRFEAKRGRS